MPSIKKRVTGFIRQLSAPSGNGTNMTNNAKNKPEIKVTSATITDEAFHAKAAQSGCFIQKYLDGETHGSGPQIYSGKTGHDLPVFPIKDLDLEVFATFTGPDGGLTSISNLEDKLNASMQVINIRYKSSFVTHRYTDTLVLLPFDGKDCIKGVPCFLCLSSLVFVYVGGKLPLLFFKDISKASEFFGLKINFFS